MIEVIAGTTIYATTGMFGRNQPDRMSSEKFYYAKSGSVIKLLDINYFFNVATYSLKSDDKLIYTYAYADGGFAVTYNNDLSGTTYRQDDYVFEDECVFRICLKRADGKDFTLDEEDRVNELIHVDTVPFEKKYNHVFDDEIEKTALEINTVSSNSTLKFCVLTDTHISVCGTWDDTVQNIKRVHEKASFDAIIHLGDFTDGMTSKKLTSEVAGQAIQDLQRNNVPVYVTIGNHDTNYFKKNPERMTIHEQCDVYLSHIDDAVREDNTPWYYKDFDSHKLRCVFLHSFDVSKVNRYGFTNKEIVWLEDVLNNTPKDFCVLVFSHIPPHTKLDYWSKRIRNQEKLVRVLKRFNKDGRLLGYIHGHTHADLIFNGYGFPVISIGCSKLEYFTNKKPDGSYTEKRAIDTISQELWDTFVVDTKQKSIDIVRFGSGENRYIKVKQE